MATSPAIIKAKTASAVAFAGSEHFCAFAIAVDTFWQRIHFIVQFASVTLIGSVVVFMIFHALDIMLKAQTIIKH